MDILHSRQLFRLIGNQKGMTGLETAVILISFVIVAAVFAYTILSAGIFSSEKSRQTIFSGLETVTSTLNVEGAITSYDLNEDGDIDQVSFMLATALGDGAIDLTQPVDEDGDGLADDVSNNLLCIAYIDESIHLQDIAWTMNMLGKNDGDHLLEKDEIAEITIDLIAVTGRLVANRSFDWIFRCGGAAVPE